MRILINGIGGPSPRSIAKSLKYYGKYTKYELFGTDINKYAHDLYDRKLYDKTFLIPPAKSPDYWPAIERIIQDHQIDVALVQPELEVLEWAKRAENNPLPCKSLIPELTLAKALYDKAIMSEYLEGYDLVPESYVLKSDMSNIEEIEKALGYPFWIRSSSGSMGLGSLKITDRKTLQNWVFINQDVEQFLASEFLPGRNLACKMLYYEGELIRAAVGERVYYIMSKVAPSGITGNTSFGRLLNDENVFYRAKKAMDILFEKTNTKKHGFFTVDLKEDKNGKAYLTEVNIRHVAFSVCFTIGGINFAEDTIRLLDNDASYDKTFKLHQFEKELIFLRDVDAVPIVMKESDLL